MKGLAICKTCGTDHSDNGGKCRGLFGIQPEPVWSGEGLPPIGCVCEYRGNDTSWGEVKIIGHDEGKVVFKPSGEDYYGITPSHKAEFIPIRAPEDVARNEAIEAIASATGLLKYGGRDQVSKDIYDAIAAGKIPGVKLE